MLRRPRASAGTNRSTLLGGAEREHRQRARRGVHRDGDADAGVGARELLEHEDVRDEVGTRTAVLLGNADARAARARRALRAARAGNRASRSHSAACGSISAARELARDRLDLPLLRRQLEVHARQTTRCEGVARSLAVALALGACGGYELALAGVGCAGLERCARPFRRASPAAKPLCERRAKSCRTASSRCATTPTPSRWNDGLPCGGRITQRRAAGESTRCLLVFNLIERPGHRCDAPGQKAAALFQRRRREDRALAPESTRAGHAAARRQPDRLRAYRPRGL